MAQEQKKSGNAEKTEEVEQPEAEHKDFDVDDLLDEIDAVLEEDAETFVKEYVQKGGQ